MNIDMRCLSAGLLILVVLGVAAALPMDLFEPEDEEEFALEDKRNQPNELYKALYPELPPRDARTRKTWRSRPYARISLVDDSVTKFDSQISVCRNKQVCKQAEKRSFRCRCPGFTQCVADGRQYDATCKYSKVGLVYHQPKY